MEEMLHYQIKIFDFLFLFLLLIMQDLFNTSMLFELMNLFLDHL